MMLQMLKILSTHFVLSELSLKLNLFFHISESLSKRQTIPHHSEFPLQINPTIYSPSFYKMLRNSDTSSTPASNCHVRCSDISSGNLRLERKCFQPVDSSICGGAEESNGAQKIHLATWFFCLSLWFLNRLCTKYSSFYFYESSVVDLLETNGLQGTSCIQRWPIHRILYWACWANGYRN